MNVLALLFALIFTSFSSEQVWRINLDHSEIHFEVDYLKVSTVSGRIHDFGGVIHFSSDLVIPELIEIKMSAASIDTSHQMRDGHLRSKDFLDVESYPEIIFKSTQVVPVSPDEFEAIGDLTIIDRTKEIVISFSLSEIVKDTWNYESRFVDFKTSMKRSEFGIVWNKALASGEYLVGDEISLRGTLQLQPINLMTPSSRHMIPESLSMRQRRSEALDRFRGRREDREVNRAEQTELEEKTLAIRSEKEGRSEVTSLDRSLTWWGAYITMGAIGFLGLLVLSFQSKSYTQKVFSKSYEEIGSLGFLSDIFVLIIGFLYAWAMWHVAIY